MNNFHTSLRPHIKSVLVKLSARCNLNCDYCYVFNNIDQGWKNLPDRMTQEIIESLALRLADHVENNDIQEFLCIFHGGEPLLLGAETIVKYKKILEGAVFRKRGDRTKLYFSLQTNGVLLKEKTLDLFQRENIGVSMSLDGPKAVQDLHRLSHSGQSSYDKSKRGIDLLKKYPSIFEGVIAVIDPRTNPEELLSFFSEINPPSCDFLLPDSNYFKKPFYKDKEPSCYVNWLKTCFDAWVEKYPHLRVRFFDNLCEAILTGSSNTEAFGFGDVSLLSIETDGSYHDTDIFKTTEEGFSSLSLNVRDNTFFEATGSQKIHNHRLLLRKDGLSNICKECSVVDICGGGCVQHRYNPSNGFDNPSIYCEELFFIINHASSKLRQILEKDKKKNTHQVEVLNSPLLSEKEILEYNKPSPNSKAFQAIIYNWYTKSHGRLKEVIDYISAKNPKIKNVFKSLTLDQQKRISIFPSIILWMTLIEREKNGIVSYDIDQKRRLFFDPFHFQKTVGFLLENPSQKVFIHEDDYMLRCVFDSSIIFEKDEAIIKKGVSLVNEALDLVRDYSPGLYEEIGTISPCIQLIRDPEAHPEKLVSFSDNQVPGCLYICVRQGDLFAPVEDIADSIIHEYRHQKLYLLEEYTTVILRNEPYVKSPWREELRPVSGLFHGLFVFYELTKFWEWVNKKGNCSSPISAKGNILQNMGMMEQAIETLKQCPLGDAGFKLLGVFDSYQKNMVKIFNERKLSA